MAAGTFDLYIEQNATFEKDIFWSLNNTPPVAVDVTGYTAKMQIRPTIASSTVLETLTTANGKIVMGTTDGKITLLLTDAVTLAYTWTTAVYDLDIKSPGGFVTRLLQGNVTVAQAVTTI